MIFIDIDEYINNFTISKSDLLIVDSIYIFKQISNKYENINVFYIKEIINKLVYKEKIITELEEKIILIDIILKKYPSLNPSLLLRRFLNSKNNPHILNKSDILRHINTLYNQHLKSNKLTDYTLRLKEIINYDFDNKFDNIILYGNFSDVNELEWSFLKNYLKKTNKLEVISVFKEEIINILSNNSSIINTKNNNYFIGFHPFSKFLLNLIKIDTTSFYDIKKLLEHNFISLKEIKVNDNEEIIFEGEKLNFEQTSQNELTQILNNIDKACIKDLSNKDEVIKRIESYFYIRKQYAMDNEISEQKYEKDFYKTIIGWKKLKEIISKIDYLINNEELDFEDFYRNILKLINYLGIDNYYKNDQIYRKVLEVFRDFIYFFSKGDYIFDKEKLYLFLKVILENTKIEHNFELKSSDQVDINKFHDFYRKNNNYYNWFEYEGHLIDIKNESISDFYTSVTQIEEFSLCPMKYFFNRKLKIRTNLLIDNELDSILKGNLLHKILEKFYSTLNQNNYLNSSINLLSEYCKTLMIDVCNEFFEPYNNIIDNLYLQKVKNELLDGLNNNKNKKGILYKVLEKDNSRIKQGWIPSEFEKKFTFEINGLNFSGSIDRVDINSDNEFEIIDYKTGNIFLNYKKIEIITGLSFQLPVYTIAYEKESGKKFHSASYFILRENLYLDVNIYPIIDKSNYKFLTNKALNNLEKLKSKLLYSKYNYTTESTERICKSCDYRYICRVNPLKSYYITNKIEKNRRYLKFLKKENNYFVDNKINKYLEKFKNKKILITNNYISTFLENNNDTFVFRNEKDFFIKFNEIEDFYDDNKNNYLINKFIENLIDKLSFKKDKYLELLLQILERKQIIDFISNIVKSNDIDFYISNNFEDIWKNYTKKYLNYCDYALNKINYIENKIKDIPKINQDTIYYCNVVNNIIKKIKDFINLFKSDKNNFNLSLDIKKSDSPVYSRNISEYINVSLHGEIVNTIYFGEYSLIKILDKFQYFSLEKEYIKAFYKIINEVAKTTYEWKNKNNILLYKDIINKFDLKTMKNKLLSKFDFIIKSSYENYLNKFILKGDLNKKSDFLILEKKNNDFKVLDDLSINKDLKINFIVTKKRLDDLIILSDIIYQIKKENKNIAIITNDDKKIKIITELFSKKKIKYFCSGYDLLLFQEVMDIINILEFINNHERYIDLIGILRSPIFCLNDTEIYNIAHDKEDILISLKELYPDIYKKINNWIELSSNLKIDDLIRFITQDSQIYKYLELDINFYIKSKNIENLINIAEKNNDCTLSEFIELIKNCKYSNEIYSDNNDYINIMTFEKSKNYKFDTLIYLDTDDLFSNQLDDIISDKINNLNYIGINLLLQNNSITESFTKKMIKEKYDEKLFEQVECKINTINKITNYNLIFIMNYKTINNSLFSKFCEINSSNINKIFI